LILKKAAITGALLAGSLFASSVASAAPYTVKAGNTLSEIANRQGINVYTLAAVNGQIVDINDILQGMKITLPDNFLRLFVPEQHTVVQTPPQTQQPQPKPAQPVQQKPQQPKPAKPTQTQQPVQKAPAAAPSSAPKYSNEVLALVNQQRANAGLQPVAFDSNLSAMAMDKAKDMYNLNYFDHNSPTYGSPFDMMKAYGISFRYAGENIAKGQQSPSQVMNDWMNSAGHRANILNSNYSKIGLAYYNGEWVQEFIG
jgi:uncharacterized YkwD family protein